MKIVFCSSEVYPFAKTGGLADVCGALPLALEKIGISVDIFLPYYRCISNEYFDIEKINKHCYKTIIGQKINVYLIKSKQFFDRGELYGDEDGDYPDNLYRFHYFCKTVLDLLKELKIEADCIHCHDWQTALIPVLLKESFGNDEFYKNIKSMLTIHNLAFQGVFPKDQYSQLKLRRELFDVNGFEFYGKINILKAGILFSDEVTTVSRQYAKEIQSKEFGCGLEGVIASRQKPVQGIVNGLDYSIWDPKTDGLINHRYSEDTYVDGKSANKTELLKRLDLDERKKVPLFGFVGRLSHQKGIDLILETVDDLIKLDLQIVIQGIGQEKYHYMLSEMAIRYEKKVAVCLEFDESLAHLIYAGSDMFLMPSLYEPCGLSQIISMRYGTIPVAFETGGLKDTIIDFRKDSQLGNGLLFNPHNQKSLFDMLKQSLKFYQDQEMLSKMISNAMKVNFSWEQSASEYAIVYQCIQ